jgi:LCP family protein required for cell wall assembly
MLNHAFQVGGSAGTIRAVEQLTDLRIDRHVVVDFSGFRDMADAVGGVQVRLKEPVDDKAAGLKPPAGKVTLDGEQALGHVWARRSLGDGRDTERMERQQRLLGALADKVKSNGVLLEPGAAVPGAGRGRLLAHHRPGTGDPARPPPVGAGTAPHPHRSHAVPDGAEGVVRPRRRPRPARRAGGREAVRTAVHGPAGGGGEERPGANPAGERRDGALPAPTFRGHTATAHTCEERARQDGELVFREMSGIAQL